MANSTIAPISNQENQEQHNAAINPDTNPSLASRDANIVLSIPSSADRIVNPALRVGIQKTDIYPIVEVNLSRGKDRNSKKRVDLAGDVASTLHRSLAMTFKGNHEISKFIFLVRVVLVSDGSAAARFWAGGTNGSNHKKSSGDKMSYSAGQAKLTLSYCLFSRESGKVAFADQKCCSKGQCNATAISEELISKDSGSRLVLELADRCARSIPKEVMTSIQQHPVPRRTTFDSELDPAQAI